MEGPLLMYHPDYTFHDIYDDPSEQFCDNNICQRTLLYIEIVCFRFRTIIINFLWRIGTFGELKWIKRDDVCYWFEEEARNNHLIYAWMIGSIETIWPDSSFFIRSIEWSDQLQSIWSDEWLYHLKTIWSDSSFSRACVWGALRLLLFLGGEWRSAVVLVLMVVMVVVMVVVVLVVVVVMVVAVLVLPLEIFKKIARFGTVSPSPFPWYIYELRVKVFN